MYKYIPSDSILISVALIFSLIKWVTAIRQVSFGGLYRHFTGQLFSAKKQKYVPNDHVFLFSVLDVAYF